MSVAIIPARGGSKRILRKNIRMFHGKPIIAYSIQTAQQSGLFDDVYVSTEDLEIADIARQYYAYVIIRPDALAEIGAPDCGTQEVTRDALVHIGTTGVNPVYACCIYATAPLMTVNDLRHGFEMLRESVGPFAYSVDISGVDAGQWYWGTRDAFIRRVPLAQGVKVQIPENRV